MEINEKTFPKYFRKRYAALLVISFLVAGTLSRSQLVDSRVGVVMTVLVAGITVVGLYLTGNLRIQLPSWFFAGITVLFVIFTIHVFAGNFESISLAAWPFYTTFVASTILFVVPTVVDERSAFRIISRFAVGIGLIGMFVVFIRPFTIPILALEVTTWHDKSAPFLPAEAAMRSVTANPNEAGILFAVGAVAAIREWFEERTRVATLLALLATLSLYLSQSRGGFVLFFASLVLYFTFKFSNPHVSMKLLALGVLGGTVFILSRIGMLPSFILFEHVPLTHRDTLWRGAVDALFSEDMNRWLLGPGIVDTGTWIEPYIDSDQVSGTPVHGAYFHFLRFGIAGAVVWIFTVWGSIFREILDNNPNHFAISLSSGFGVLMIFEGVNVFDTRIGALLMAFAFGYMFVGASRIIKVERPVIDSRVLRWDTSRTNKPQ
jgi:hypothetical protein